MPEVENLDILKNFYKPHNQQLEEYLGKPLTHWT
jgi:hypothetical protein